MSVPIYIRLKGWKTPAVVLCSPQPPQGKVAEEQTPPRMMRGGGDPLPADEVVFALSNLNGNFCHVCTQRTLRELNRIFTGVGEYSPTRQGAAMAESHQPSLRLVT